MRIAVAHYHLRPGGVTRVIERALLALEDKVDFLVLSGGPPASDFRFKDKVLVVPGLGYHGGDKQSARPESLFASLVSAAEQGLGGAPDVWHFHNHSLGKNCALTAAVPLIAERNKILLQIHDFAEDGRPALFKALFRDVGGGDLNGLGRILYPQRDNVHYAVLNGRDHALLSASGVPECRLHLLPNPAVLPADSCSAQSDALSLGNERLFLYSTRAIRRKNMGEFLLWSALAGKDERFAVTLAPENPLERPFYERWVKLAEKLSLPVAFELGPRSGMPLSRLLDRSFATVSTSVAEGFGLAFLETWLAGRPVFGRALPEITREFEQAGVDLSNLYDRLMVPLNRSEKSALLRKIRDGIESVHSEYGRLVPRGAAETALSASMRDGSVDFAMFDEDLQRKLIMRISGSKSLRNEIIPNSLIPPGVDLPELVARNNTAVQRGFSIKKYGDDLMRIYRLAAGSDIGIKSGVFDINKLLDEFLAPERFRLLRT